MSNQAILKISDLTKCYATRRVFRSEEVLAVNQLNFEVDKGEIFGFVGPNGAGKTTTLNMILGITKPSGGTIEIFGKKFQSGQIEPLARIGYVPEATFLPDYFSIIELLDFYAQLFDISVSTKFERIKHLLDITGLFEERHTLLKNLSMGQRRLVDFMQALINDPDLILLDEPTVYLDPLIMENFRRTLLHLKEQGKTIVMSSQVLSEIERVSDWVAIIYKGRLLKEGPKNDFMQSGTMENEFLRIIKNAEHSFR